MALIECKNISIKYEKQTVVENVSFTVDEGDYICIVGENGTGKSTLLKGILGLLKLSSGSVEMSGVSSKEIGYLPQQTQVQKDFPASVFEVVMSGFQAKAFSFYNKNHKKEAMEKLELLGIADLKKKSYMDLSGGQQQRVLLARALCSAEKLLVLDEPVTGLDPVVTVEFYEILSKLKNEQKLSVLMVSHDIDKAVTHANKILQIDKTALFFGETKDYIKTELYKKMTGGNLGA